jgi:NAD(P)-dependent dehydrogenase (short-subunit alcohol dehydrogenase family)
MANVLITGTSSGIGSATAVVLARAGHTVYATMRSLARGAALRDLVERERLPVSIMEMDVDSDASVDAATSAIRARSGCIGVLVNNAGIVRAGSIEGLGFDDFKATMETNYFGALRTIKTWLPDMRERRSGCIINVTSVAGRIATSPLSPYCASKFALEALSEALAQEVRPFNVRVAIVQPGIIDTPMARDIEHVHTDPVYPHVRRFGYMFEASLDTPTPPTIVAEKIREIVESDTRTLPPSVRTPKGSWRGAPRRRRTRGPSGEACPMRHGTSACATSSGSMRVPSGTRAYPQRRAAFQ